MTNFDRVDRFKLDRRPCINNRLKSPCKDCLSRKPACSDHCERFKEFKETTAEMHKWLQDYKNVEYYQRVRDKYTAERKWRKKTYGK